jgi:anti-anti-sigma factor
MQLVVEERDGVHIVRVQETKLTYPVLSSFFAEVRQLVDTGVARLVIDLQAVSYIDSASIGCLMDIHRLLEDKGGAVRLSGLQPRVETMLSMTGVHKIIDIHRAESDALSAFGRRAAGGSGGARESGDA